MHSKLYRMKKNRKLALILLMIMFLIIFVGSLFFGRYFISPLNILKIIVGWKDGVDSTEWSLFLLIRLPRVILVSIVGMALSISGVIYQSMFRNPLVSPNILGVSAGCSFGAALSIILPFGFPYFTELSAFVFGIIAVASAYNISRFVKSSPVLLLILGGIIISSFFNALLSFLQYIADPYTHLPSITYWIMGGFFKASWSETVMAGVVILPLILVLLLLSNQLNILSLGDDDAKSLGIDVKFLRVTFITITTIMVAISVSVSGSIAWLGLIIPHITRSIVGANHQVSVPASMFIGAICLLIADDISRTLAPSEIPIGILISFVGAPIFAYLLIKTKTERGFREN